MLQNIICHQKKLFLNIQNIIFYDPNKYFSGTSILILDNFYLIYLMLDQSKSMKINTELNVTELLLLFEFAQNLQKFLTTYSFNWFVQNVFLVFANNVPYNKCMNLIMKYKFSKSTWTLCDIVWNGQFAIQDEVGTKATF